MILKMNNKDKDFYNYVGKVFGSRVIEKETGDRIYDDDEKQWYIYVENNVGTDDPDGPLAVVSINNGIIKNVYTKESKYLEELLDKVIKECNVLPSVVTNKYIPIYEKNFIIYKTDTYKNFVIISTK